MAGKASLHALTAMPGVQRAVAADLDGDRDLDIAAVSYLPAEEFPRLGEMGLDAVLWLEQVGPGRFVRHPLEKGSCDHFACAADPLGDGGAAKLVVGNFCLSKGRPISDTLTVWKRSPPAASLSGNAAP